MLINSKYKRPFYILYGLVKSKKIIKKVINEKYVEIWLKEMKKSKKKRSKK